MLPVVWSCFMSSTYASLLWFLTILSFKSLTTDLDWRKGVSYFFYRSRMSWVNLLTSSCGPLSSITVRPDVDRCVAIGGSEVCFLCWWSCASFIRSVIFSLLNGLWLREVYFPPVTWFLLTLLITIWCLSTFLMFISSWRLSLDMLRSTFFGDTLICGSSLLICSLIERRLF